MAEKSGHRWKTRILHCIEPFVCFVSMILQIVGFSMQGLKACYQSEAAFRQELWLSIVLISLAGKMTKINC
jgi:hypothetical protein